MAAVLDEFAFDIVASGLRAPMTLLTGAARATAADGSACPALTALGADATATAAAVAAVVFAPAASSTSERGDRKEGAGPRGGRVPEAERPPVAAGTDIDTATAGLVLVLASLSFSAELVGGAVAMALVLTVSRGLLDDEDGALATTCVG